jgi:hypothetical protein|tara:strand:+ start:1696 stop:1917 length:222 start_codon:yes stop_codon:yes gene_type:complete
MNLIELERKIAEHKVIDKFQDGLVDGLIYGRRDENQSHHYYNRGYDFGLTLYGKLNKYLEDNNIRVSRDETLK